MHVAKRPCVTLYQLVLVSSLLVGSSAVVIELLKQNLFCTDVKRFLQADSAIWTSFLRTQRGFVSKDYWMDPHNSRDMTGNCTVYQHVTWQTRELWKAISDDELNTVNARFVDSFGYQPDLTALPSGDGFDVLQ